MKRMLDVLRPKIEVQLKSWGSSIPDGGDIVPGERLSEVTVMLRTKFRNYLQAVVEKLAENVGVHHRVTIFSLLQISHNTSMYFVLSWGIYYHDVLNLWHFNCFEI